MKRTFIAVTINPSEQLKESYQIIRHRLRLEKINWVLEHHLHITLNFLGDTQEEKLPEIMEKLGIILERHEPFHLVIQSLGVFKSLHEPRVIWMGSSICPTLKAIKTDLDQALSKFGYEPENREFSPHLTLGRVKQIRQLNQLSQLLTLFKEVDFQQHKVMEIVWYESKWLPSGPEYIPICVFPLMFR